jgi:hypothetical protein
MMTILIYDGLTRGHRKLSNLQWLNMTVINRRLFTMAEA